jgi:hypothetical protein
MQQAVNANADQTANNHTGNQDEGQLSGHGHLARDAHIASFAWRLPARCGGFSWQVSVLTQV